MCRILYTLLACERCTAGNTKTRQRCWLPLLIHTWYIGGRATQRSPDAESFAPLAPFPWTFGSVRSNLAATKFEQNTCAQYSAIVSRLQHSIPVCMTAVSITRDQSNRSPKCHVSCLTSNWVTFSAAASGRATTSS